MRAAGNVYEMFPEQAGAPTRMPAVDRSQFVIPVGSNSKHVVARFSSQAGLSSEDQSLALAEREDFFSMCSSSLWGSERDVGSPVRAEFGEMLRGLVQQYQPTNRWQLFLLARVADAAWKLHRLTRLQNSTFHAFPGETAGGRARGLDEASAIDAEISQANKHFIDTLKGYRDAVSI